jgi:hypothetical protein
MGANPMAAAYAAGQAYSGNFNFCSEADEFVLPHDSAALLNRE